MLRRIKTFILAISIGLLLFSTESSLLYARSAEMHAGLSLIQGINEKSEWVGLIQLNLLEVEILKEEDIKNAVKNVMPSVAAIQCGGYIGSGSIFEMTESSVIIVSNRHLLMNDSEAEITFFDETKVMGKVVGISQQIDVGFVEINTEDIPYWTKKKIRKVYQHKEQAVTIDFGTEIFVIGCTDGVGKNIEEGSILNPEEFFEEFASSMIRIYCKGKPGMSGGGTFDAYGNYIGMLTGGLGDESASLPLALIVEEFQKTF